MAEKPFVFLIGPRDKAAAMALAEVIEDAISELGLALRTWFDAASPGVVTVAIVECLRDAEVVLADLRGDRPNVYYEVGIAHGYHRPVVLLLRKGERPDFNLRDLHSIEIAEGDAGAVDNTSTVRGKITKAVRAARAEGPTSAVEYAALRAASTAPAAPPNAEVWRDLALTGRLPELAEDHVRIDVLVAHVELGSGRIVAHSAVQEPPVRVTIDFRGARHGFVLPDPRLYLADVRAVSGPASPGGS